MTQPYPQPSAAAVRAVVVDTSARRPGGDLVPLRPGGLSAVRGALEGSPGRLRIAAAAAVLACLVFALLGGSAFQAWGGALDDARGDAAQLVRVQGIQNNLLAADAAAANAFLSGGAGGAGAGGAAQAVSYASAASTAAGQVVAAAAANPADAAVLASVNDELATYKGLVERALANNRQQLPVGAAYLRQAGDLLRGTIVPSLDQVSAADRQRVTDAYGSADAATGRLVAAGVIVLLGLVLVQLWLARRTHRILNPMLAAGTVGVLVALVAGAVALSGTAKRTTDVGSTSYAATVALAQARTAAFDAKSQESLGLINRGNSGPNEKLLGADLATATSSLAAARSAGAAGASADRLTAWSAAHKAVRALDDKGKWVDARDAATGTGPGTSNAVFALFDTASAADLAAQAKAVDDGLSASRTLLLVLGWLTLVLGLVAAGAAWSGVSQRLEEYR